VTWPISRRFTLRCTVRIRWRRRCACAAVTARSFGAASRRRSSAMRRASSCVLWVRSRTWMITCGHCAICAIRRSTIRLRDTAISPSSRRTRRNCWPLAATANIRSGTAISATSSSSMISTDTTSATSCSATGPSSSRKARARERRSGVFPATTLPCCGAIGISTIWWRGSCAVRIC